MQRQEKPRPRGPHQPVVPGESHEVGRVLRALADPTRRLLLKELDTRVGLPMSYLMEEDSCSRQAVHKHLQVLIRAGLVIKSCDGKAMIYYMDPTPIRRVFAELGRRYKRDTRPLGNLYRYGMPYSPWG